MFTVQKMFFVCFPVYNFNCYFKDQAPVVQRVDSAIHWITQLILIALMRWTVIYPVDSTIHPLNNWGQVVKYILKNCVNQCDAGLLVFLLQCTKFKSNFSSTSVFGCKL